MRTFVIAGVTALGLAALPLTAADAGSHWRVGTRANTDQVVTGKAVFLTGKVHPIAGAAGRKVVLQEKFKPGKPWVNQRKARVRANGTYTLKDRPTTNFTHRYRVVMPAAGHHKRGVSRAVTVTVFAWTPLTLQTWVNNNAMSFGVVNINGTSFQNSVWNRWDTSGSIEFNVNHKCIKVGATFGVSDDSVTGSQAEVSIESDGASIYTNTFTVGQSEKKTMSLDPAPLKLRLEAHNTSTTTGAVGYGAFGMPEVLCTR